MTTVKTRPFVFDLVLRRPGCVLLQAAMGGSPDVAKQIPCEHWLTELTTDMALYAIPENELKRLVEHFGGKLRG